MVQSQCREACICYPGDEIPEWFTYQSMGSSVNIKPPHSEHWHGSGFLGFSLCCVAAFEEHNYSHLGLAFQVEVHLKTNSGKFFESKYELTINHYDKEKPTIINSSKEKLTIVNSDHVLIWYESKIYWACKQVKEGIITEVSFHFYPVDNVHSCKVKSCGVRPLYSEEAIKAIFS